MKKNKNIVLKVVFLMFFMSFLVVYFASATGYYEYQNHNKSKLTEEQIRKFEKDVKDGKTVDLNEYLSTNDIEYKNNFTKFTSSVSDTISNIVESGIEKTFKYLSKLMNDE